MGKKKDKKKDSGSTVMMDEYGNPYATNEQEMRNNYDIAAAEKREKQNKYNAAQAKVKAAEQDYFSFTGDPEGKKMEKMMAAWDEEKKAKEELEQAQYKEDFAFAAFQHDGKGGWQFNQDGQKAFVEEHQARKEWHETFEKRESESRRINNLESDIDTIETQQAGLKAKYKEAKEEGKWDEAEEYRQQYWQKEDEKDKKKKEIEEAQAERRKTGAELSKKTEAVSAAHEKTRKTKLPPKKKTALEAMKERISSTISNSSKPLAEYSTDKL